MNISLRSANLNWIPIADEIYLIHCYFDEHNGGSLTAFSCLDTCKARSGLNFSPLPVKVLYIS